MSKKPLRRLSDAPELIEVCRRALDALPYDKPFTARGFFPLIGVQPMSGVRALRSHPEIHLMERGSNGEGAQWVKRRIIPGVTMAKTRPKNPGCMVPMKLDPKKHRYLPEEPRVPNLKPLAQRFWKDYDFDFAPELQAR